MTLAKAREQYNANRGEGPEFDTLSHEEQMKILEAAVRAERAGRPVGRRL